MKKLLETLGFKTKKPSKFFSMPNCCIWHRDINTVTVLEEIKPITLAGGGKIGGHRQPNIVINSSYVYEIPAAYEAAKKLLECGHYNKSQYKSIVGLLKSYEKEAATPREPSGVVSSLAGET